MAKINLPAATLEGGHDDLPSVRTGTGMQITAKWSGSMNVPRELRDPVVLSGFGIKILEHRHTHNKAYQVRIIRHRHPDAGYEHSRNSDLVPMH